MGMLNEVRTTSTVVRSLQVFLLAMCGLLFYAGVIVLLGFAGAFVLSAYAHAQLPRGHECRIGLADTRCTRDSARGAQWRVPGAADDGPAIGEINEAKSP